MVLSLEQIQKLLIHQIPAVKERSKQRPSMLKKKRWESGNGLGVFVTVGPVRSSGVPPHELGEERVTSLRTCVWEAMGPVQ